MFQSANCGCAHRHHPAFFNQRTVDLCGGLARDGEGLAVHLVFFNLFGPHRLKCSQTHMQCNLRNFDSSLADLRQHLRSEMKAGGGCGNATRIRGIDGLVSLPVFRLVWTGDVWRQRNMAMALHQGKKVRYRLEAQRTLAIFSTASDFRFKSRAKMDLLSHHDFSAGAHQGLPLPLPEPSDKQDFHLTAEELACGRVSGAERLGAQSHPSSKQTGRKDTAIVQDRSEEHTSEL